jgi:hypothetical protein
MAENHKDPKTPETLSVSSHRCFKCRELKTHRPRAKPNRTAPLRHCVHQPGHAGEKTPAQSASQEPITIAVNVEIAPAHSYTQLPECPGHKDRLAHSSGLSGLKAQASKEAKLRFAQATVGLHSKWDEGIYM